MYFHTDCRPSHEDDWDIMSIIIVLVLIILRLKNIEATGRSLLIVSGLSFNLLDSIRSNTFICKFHRLPQS